MINKQMILFDMDGTLLPMDIDEFTKGYFKLILAKFVPMGYDGDELVNAIWAGTAAMVKNDGSKYNEEVFWNTFTNIIGERAHEDRMLFDAFYENEFNGAREFCGFNPEITDLVKRIKNAGFRVAVATNPIFPLTAMKKRLEWSGLDPDDFELITSYENSRFSKPNPAYFADTAARLGVSPEQCLMIGNDANEDTPAEKVGMDVFLLTDHLLNRYNVDISEWPNGNLSELTNYIFE